jgi:hypothetical protein
VKPKVEKKVLTGEEIGLDTLVSITGFVKTSGMPTDVKWKAVSIPEKEQKNGWKNLADMSGRYLKGK